MRSCYQMVQPLPTGLRIKTNNKALILTLKAQCTGPASLILPTPLSYLLAFSGSFKHDILPPPISEPHTLFLPSLGSTEPSLPSIFPQQSLPFSSQPKHHFLREALPELDLHLGLSVHW